MIRVARLNHAVLFVRDLDVAMGFYERAFGFEEVAREADGQMGFLKARGSTNHHDLGLLALGPGAPRPPRGATGLYHLAWEVPAIEDLEEAARTLSAERALVGASDHGATKSLYGRDPDGLEFEVVWIIPAHLLDDEARRARTSIRPLDLAKEKARYGAATPGGVGVSRAAVPGA
jgi:catechol-2,3-dioxygenase